VRQLTDDEAARHNAAYERGWKLAKPYMLLSEAPQAPRLGWAGRRRLNQAIESLREALAIAPENWPTLWALGKIYQRLGRADQALESLRAAFELNPTHPDVAREAGLAALAAGDGRAAIRYCTAARSTSPDDAGLVSNLALAYLISGEIERASATAHEAIERDPGDAVSRRVLARVENVRAGKRPAPQRIQEARQPTEPR
jgi:Flp pilus assembly protein TadD